MQYLTIFSYPCNATATIPVFEIESRLKFDEELIHQMGLSVLMKGSDKTPSLDHVISVAKIKVKLNFF